MFFKILSDISFLKEAAEQVIKIHSEGWRDGGKTINEWQRTLRDYAFPKLANKRINTIKDFVLRAPHVGTLCHDTETIR